MDLQPYQRKFVEDNWNIQLLRQNANIDRASKQIRKLIQDQLDRNNPATSVINHMVMALDQDPMLNTRFITLSGYGAQKSDLHRKLQDTKDEAGYYTPGTQPFWGQLK